MNDELIVGSTTSIYMDKNVFLQRKSLRQISKETGKSYTSVRYWYHKYKSCLPTKIIIPTDDELINAVKNSNSLAHALRILNRSYVGSNYRFIKKSIVRLNLDTSHWKSYGISSQTDVRISWSYVLMENSNYSLNTSRRKRLVKDGLLQNVCSICQLLPMWNNKPLSLRLDHINGKRNDHRLSNLRFVCPNCDSQLPTYCSKNRTYQRLINSNGQSR